MLGLSIFVGGGLGSLIRWLATLTCNQLRLPFWSSTMLVNIVGTLILLFLYKFSSENSSLDPMLRIGILGGLTTFSTFSLDLFKAMESLQWGSVTIILLGNVLSVFVISFLFFKFS